MKTQRKIEYSLLWQLKFFANSLEFDLQSEELGLESEFTNEFRAKQVETLQASLALIKAHWEQMGAGNRPLPSESSTL